MKRILICAALPLTEGQNYFRAEHNILKILDIYDSVIKQYAGLHESHAIEKHHSSTIYSKSLSLKILIWEVGDLLVAEYSAMTCRKEAFANAYKFCK